MPRERCAQQISPKCCIVSASLSAAAFAPKCRVVRFYIWCVGAGFYAVERSGTSALGVSRPPFDRRTPCDRPPKHRAAVSFRASDRRHWRGNPSPFHANQRPKAATYLCRFAAKARFDNRPNPRRVFPKREGTHKPKAVGKEDSVKETHQGFLSRSVKKPIFALQKS